MYTPFNGSRRGGARRGLGSASLAPTRGGTFSQRGQRGNQGGLRGGGGRFCKKFKPPPMPDISLHPLGELVATISNEHLELAAVQTTDIAPVITECNYIASYNWMDSQSPTILVPGKPPLWTPLKEARQLPEDKGNFFRDQNAARYPRYPTEPTIQAILTTNSDFATDKLDIVACGSTMGKLLRFVRHIDNPFRAEVEVVGNTVFIVRKENSPRELIPDVRGFGHSFPDNYTTWEKDVKGSETNQRVIQYDFAGIKCIVRFECDGYLGELASGSAAQVATPDTGADIIESIGATSISQVQSASSDDLQVRYGGSEIPRTSIFDLKTRSGRFKKEIDMEDMLPILWVRQIPNFIIAYHNGEGVFEDIRVKSVESDVQDWERKNEMALKRLAVLIREIISFAKANNEGRIEIYCPNVDHLELRKRHSENQSVALPPSLIARWESSMREEEDEDDNTVAGAEQSAVDCDSYETKEPDWTACSEDCGYCGTCSY